MDRQLVDGRTDRGIRVCLPTIDGVVNTRLLISLKGCNPELTAEVVVAESHPSFPV